MMTTIPQLRRERIDATLEAVHQAASGTGPIVIGPWLGEIGFELLYWIPFLRWALPEVRVPASRCVVLSRGGCGAWYDGLADGYVELYDTISPDELRVLNRERIAQQAAIGPDVGLHRGQMTAKQYGIVRAEREILRRVRLDGTALLHPSVMYTLFRFYWRKRLRDLYASCTRPRPLPIPAALLTGPYVAVKFYSSQACADQATTADTVQRVVDRLAATMPVVVLDSGDRYDDHGAFASVGPTVTRVGELDPCTNLALQSAVIAHASAFVGTYGGFAYLAPFLGVPTTACYSVRNYRGDHYQVIAGLCRQWDVRFEVSDLATTRVRLDRGVWTHAA